ncbi:hypothetical protein P3L10_010282 [Capsicum annuum]
MPPDADQLTSFSMLSLVSFPSATNNDNNITSRGHRSTTKETRRPPFSASLPPISPKTLLPSPLHDHAVTILYYFVSLLIMIGEVGII